MLLFITKMISFFSLKKIITLRQPTLDKQNSERKQTLRGKKTPLDNKY